MQTSARFSMTPAVRLLGPASLRRTMPSTHRDLTGAVYWFYDWFHTTDPWSSSFSATASEYNSPSASR
ncbi:hypothetical protein GCM10010191_46040 [Actinomadura vinacea]|uniref:Uncharacterized protein n=1 Tax=Actinomadura vinacea TaxID=115336 RepID=A0ABN3JDW9_9ACTN